MNIIIFSLMTISFLRARFGYEKEILPMMDTASDKSYLQGPPNPYTATVNPLERLISDTYLKVTGILSHYFAYYQENVAEFRRWFQSIYYEMDDDTRKKILNELNLNLRSMDDLENFWTETQGAILKGNLLELSDLLKGLEEAVNAKTHMSSEANNDLIKSKINFKDKAVDFLNQLNKIYGFLDLGLSYHTSNRFTDVHAMFLDAAASKKKLDKSFESISGIDD
ncbi:hypothetical protein NBO_60g0001 [Nosema bombycis CQ1]|uniref:Spore wall protein 26 n=1 Tax=Nosema bombycis (strain CQ1 / CVCC 102059) TaxID=578461 RepID=SWP26_NOSB1|nr:RecName: Full=Spore wall protein 26; Flags: Precursor [Nosema bombycis CQ1]EOB13745.1 hypothetical protein NBO_60g0001 [Nosema bombycis CQ1]|eukprot:EOB13745.1 hypothetical protein NBO_60g0001 [Nosema bombycis CQ1]